MFLRKVTAGRAEATARLAGRLQAATSTLTAAAARMRGSNTAAVARRALLCCGHCPTLRYLPLWWQKNSHQKMEALLTFWNWKCSGLSAPLLARLSIAPKLRDKNSVGNDSFVKQAPPQMRDEIRYGSVVIRI